MTIKWEKKLELKAAVNFGLSQNLAGKLLGVGSASRLVRQTNEQL